MNKNLYIAKNRKNDEFYTQLIDIEKELKHYNLENKIIYLNCDNPYESNFYKYFKDNFDKINPKKVITTFYSRNNKTYKTILTKDLEIKVPIEGNGDFRSDESIKNLKKCDVVITNPPFSLIGDFINILIKYNKDFLIIGSKNITNKKEIAKLIVDKLIHTGINHGTMYFKTPNGKLKKFSNIRWYTNLNNNNNKKYKKIKLDKIYKKNNYNIYYNYDAINIDRIKDIPKDYKGLMGVPVTFIDLYNPDEYEIVAISNNYINTKYNHIRINKDEYAYVDNEGNILHKMPYSIKEAKIGNSLRLQNKDGSPGKIPYTRVIIKKIT